MKKLGFTLAEVLITLTIVGVIAAITLPSISANVQKKSIGPTLAKAVNNLETSNRIMMQEAGVTNLKTAIAQRVSKEDEKGDVTGYYTQLLETTLQGGLNEGLNTFITKDGIEYKVTEKPLKDSSPAITLEDKYAYKYWVVDIDTNGTGSGADKEGFDKFQVLVDNLGAVIPVGGNEYKRYMGSAADSTLKCDTDTQTLGCTGKIADNGWKIMY